jgi:hypothetical protein
MKKICMMIIVAIFSCAGELSASFFADAETGAVFTGYNDVRIPDDSGTKFSLKDDIKTDPSYFVRFKFGYTFLENHSLFILIAPLTLRGRSAIDKDIYFQGEHFPAGSEVQSTYKFNSYRLTYMYTFLKTSGLKLGAGLTGKIRDAEITLEDDNHRASRSNVGFVPLIHFMAEWMFLNNMSVLLDGDALASPQGRAEDVLLAIQYHTNPHLIFRAGYRMLEGGSDGGGSVYTFAMFHYIVFGVSFIF